jgi:biotin operon repressor
MFLSPADLRELTGYARPSRQIEQLRRMGIPFWVNAAGRPIVSKAALEGQQAEQTKTWEPSWAGSRAAI